MKPISKKKASGIKVSRSATKVIAPGTTRKVSAKKPTIREGVIRAPVRNTGTAASILLFDEAAHCSASEPLSATPKIAMRTSRQNRLRRT